VDYWRDELNLHLAQIGIEYDPLAAAADLITVVRSAIVRRSRNSSCHVGNIAAESVTNLAEDREGDISFTSLDSSKVTPVQSTVRGETVLAKPLGLAFGLNPAAQP
jgi:hypothetical protein